MSFRYATGDFATAIGLVIKVIKALDSGGGATKHYREATAFLQNLKDTLEPLQAATLFEAYPTYGQLVRQQVDKIELAVDHFLKLAENFEPDLGGTQPIGSFRHVSAKLKWRFSASKALTELMTELSGYMRVLDTLLLRFVVETGNKLDAQLSTIKRKGDEQRGAILESLQLNFEPLKAELEARDEQLMAFVEQLLEDLQPLRDDLEKIERTRDTQHWRLVHGLQQQTAAIKPLHGEISNFQSAADQNFHTVFTKLDDHAAAVDSANKMLSSIGSALFGGLGRLYARTTPVSAAVSSLEQSLDESCYALPQVEDEDGWLMFQECGSKPPENSEPVDDEDKPKGATTIDKLLTRVAPVVNLEPTSDIRLLEETKPAQEAEVQRSIELSKNNKLKEDLQPETNVKYPRRRKPRKKPAQGLVVTQQMERLEAIYSKIMALENRLGSEDKITVQRSDYLKLEQAAAVIVRAYEVVAPLENSTTSSSRRFQRRNKETNRDWNKPKVAQPYPSQYSSSNFQTGRVYEIPEDGETMARAEAVVPYSEFCGDGYGNPASNYNIYYELAAKSSSEEDIWVSYGAPHPRDSLAPPTQTISFIFVVNNLKMASGCERFLPRPPPGSNEPPALGRQTRGNDFVHINGSDMYHWENGVIRHANEYSFTNTPYTTPLKEYRAVTMFYNRGFVLAEGDASTRDMRKQKYPRDRWFGLRFLHGKSLSRVDLTGGRSYMAARPNIQLVNSLGLGNYQNHESSECSNHGLNGNLAIVLALIAFSCRCEALDEVFMSSWSGWNNYQWTPHEHGPDGRRDGRGMVVTVYLDPRNPVGSTPSVLHELEWVTGAILR